MIATTRQLYKHADSKYALGAYNINSAERTMGLFNGCIDSKALSIASRHVKPGSANQLADLRKSLGA